MTTRTVEIITALVVCALGLLLVQDAVRLGNGWASDGPQAGFYPFYVGLMLAAAAAFIAIREWRASPGEAFVGPGRFRLVLAMLLPSVAYVAAIYLIGLYVASALFLAAFMRWQGKLAIGKILAIAIGVPLLVFLVFERWFQVALPKGPLETWLGF